MRWTNECTRPKLGVHAYCKNSTVYCTLYNVHTDVTVQCTCTSWAEGSNPAPPSMIPGALQDHCEILQNSFQGGGGNLHMRIKKTLSRNSTIHVMEFFCLFRARSKLLKVHVMYFLSLTLNSVLHCSRFPGWDSSAPFRSRILNCSRFLWWVSLALLWAGSSTVHDSCDGFP